MIQAVFLDRDGVINEVLTKRVKFVNKPSDFFLLNGVGEAIKKLNDAQFLVFVVTNQGGVGLGFMKEKMLTMIHERMKEELLQYGATIDEIAYCPHQPNAGCHCRKPQAYLLKKIAQKYNVDLQQSIMVGDREPDIVAGKNAGCKTILVHARSEDNYGADFVYSDLLQAIPQILQLKK